jgi:hypothetical protein
MGKASRIKQQSAREKIAAQREMARRLERRNRILITGGSTLVVLAIVLVFVIVKVSQGSGGGNNASSNGRTALPASVASQVTGVPAATLDAVGKGAVPSFSTNPPFTVGSGAALTSGGKPEMLYIGAEFCPYCAAMRWSMAIALSRFGTLTPPLRGIHSSPSDTFPNTATLTFYKAGYTSNYLTFTPVENLTVSHSLLQSPTKEQNALWAQYEPDANNRGYPFIDFGNKLVMKGPIYNAGVLAGKSWSQIAATLHDPASPITQSVVGAANYITGAICRMTSNQPASVCTSAAVKAVQGGL